jgi:hypothetical protein
MQDDDDEELGGVDWVTPDDEPALNYSFYPLAEVNRSLEGLY